MEFAEAVVVVLGRVEGVLLIVVVAAAAAEEEAAALLKRGKRKVGRIFVLAEGWAAGADGEKTESGEEKEDSGGPVKTEGEDGLEEW